MRVKVYDDEMIKKFNNLLTFDYDESGMVIVKGIKRPTRKTYHAINKSFEVNLKTLKCKIRFTPIVMKIWLDLKKDYTLFEVQNAANILISTYQDITKEKILEELKKK